MIDLNEFTDKELSILEELIDNKLSFEYEFKEKHQRVGGKFFEKKNGYIESLTVLKTKIINKRNSRENHKEIQKTIDNYNK